MNDIRALGMPCNRNSIVEVFLMKFLVAILGMVSEVTPEFQPFGS